MVKITGNFGKVKSWINKRIRLLSKNTFIGLDTGKVTSGDYNLFAGYQVGYKNTSGYNNNFIGYQAGYKNISGYNNNFMGYQAGHKNTGGYKNSLVGYQAGFNNTSGYFNNFIGYLAGYANTDGDYNSYFGNYAGYSNINGIYNNFVGNKAGYYETGNYKLFIDVLSRDNEADARIKALIYGIFNAATANQRLSINAQLLIREVTTYADDAAAGSGGLVTGEIYKHADGSLHIKL